MRTHCVTNQTNMSFGLKVRFSFPGEQKTENIKKAIELIKDTCDFHNGHANMPTGFSGFKFDPTKNSGSFEIDDCMRNSVKGIMKSFISKKSGTKIFIRTIL